MFFLNWKCLLRQNTNILRSNTRNNVIRFFKITHLDNDRLFFNFKNSKKGKYNTWFSHKDEDPHTCLQLGSCLITFLDQRRSIFVRGNILA